MLDPGLCAMLPGKAWSPLRFLPPSVTGSVAVRHSNDSMHINQRKKPTMRQVQVRIKTRLRQTTVADPPTINRKIARTWFPESA